MLLLPSQFITLMMSFIIIDAATIHDMSYTTWMKVLMQHTMSCIVKMN